MITNSVQEKHPQIGYWFCMPETFENGRYIEEVEDLMKNYPFDLIFITAREGCDFYNVEQYHSKLEEIVDIAHRYNKKIGLQIWRSNNVKDKEQALALLCEGEELLDDEGQVTYVSESKGGRVDKVIDSELYRVVLFKKCGMGLYEEGTLIDVTDQCDITYLEGRAKMCISLDMGEAYKDYTAYFLVAHYHKTPDLFSTYYEDIFKEVLGLYSDIAFDGIGLDEFKSMPIVPPHQIWYCEPFRARVYGKHMEKLFDQRHKMTFRDVLLESRYVASNETHKRIRAINYYFDFIKEASIRNEQYFYNYAKEMYGKDVFIGLHNTYHNALTNDEVWETGCMWWDIPREYGHTDEDIAYPVRNGIALSYEQPIVYDMYYTEGENYNAKAEPYFKKAMRDVRYNCRVHYHGYSDERPNRYNMKNNYFKEQVTKIEDQVKLINTFDPVHVKNELLIVFGRPALTNWYPHYDLRNGYDINGGLHIIEKSQALWDAGVVCALVPSTKIQDQVLSVKDGKVVYNGHVFEHLLYLYPEYSKQDTLDFIEEAAGTDCNVMIVGDITYNFEGEACSDQVARIYRKAKKMVFSIEEILQTGVSINTYQQGCALEDGSVLVSDYRSLVEDKPKQFEGTINGHKVVCEYKGVLGIKLKDTGEVDKFVCGGFRELHINGKKALEVENQQDYIYRV